MTDIVIAPTQPLPNGTSHDVDEVQMDSITISRDEQHQQAEENYLGRLVKIDEEMGTDDLHLLKFVCRDEIGGSKLESITSAIDIFKHLKTLDLINHSDSNYLIECLGLIHRFDLIRKLGHDSVVIDGIKQQFHTFDRVGIFRKLLLEIAEDLDDTELNKMKFLLSGSVRKKRLQDFDNALDLFVYMEKEDMLAHHKTAQLCDMLTNIKRTDLVKRIQRYSGVDTSQPANTRSQIIPSGQRQNGAAENRPESRAFTGPPVVQSRLVQSQSRAPAPLTVNRSPSAGTLSCSSSENDIPALDSTVPLPNDLKEDIVNDVVNAGKWVDFTISINLTNEQIERYERGTSDGYACMRQALEDWFGKQANKKAIVPQLIYILGELNLKRLKDRVVQWNEGQGHVLALSTERQRLAGNSNRLPSRDQNINFTANAGEAQSPHIPVGPPENNYTSLESAKPMRQDQGRQAGQDEIQVSQLQDRVNALQVGQNVIQQIQNQPFPYRTHSEPMRLPAQTNSSVAAATAPVTHISTNVPTYQHSPQAMIAPIAIAPVTNMPTNVPMNQPSTSTQAATNVAAPHVPVNVYQQTQGVLPQQNPAQSRPAVVSGELPVYPMRKTQNGKRGWCVIINNRDFKVDPRDKECKEMPQRTGTDVDAQQLQHVFETLGFIVKRRDNLTHIEMMNYLIDISYNVDHSSFDCFVCCILTHGVLNHLYGTDGRLVSIKDLTTTFQANRCPTLAGKPKLFFLQACQGRDKMTAGRRVMEKDAAGGTETDAEEMIPNEADFLIGYATVPGYVSFRSRTHGSWYIRKLCENLEKLSHREDLVSILVQVNNEVSKANANMEDGIYKQIPAPLVTLTKKLYFR